ncbi:MAG: glycosyltransferase family 1 protein [Tannerellaceae bacterium]|nr:glycosyltransferase family 1 protein [Tannerellaceae bacterium]
MLNIVSFNVPYPPNYGGIIDVYYKLKALHAAGVRIILHCFDYGRGEAPELEAFCEKVYYYKRRTGLMSNLSLLPYNVYSRRDPELLRNLLSNNYPILFEALHTCYYINDERLKGRLKIYRESNIEHDYYHHLSKAARGVIKKTFLRIEAWRYRRYEKVLKHADLMLAVSMADTEYLAERFPEVSVEYMPSFHAADRVTSEPGQSDFILYHGNLSVAENEHAALYLIRNVFGKLDYRCVIAGMNPSERLIRAASAYPNIVIEANPSQQEMDCLTGSAQIQTLITFQDTGLKLKLLNSLFAGRHTLVNHLMLTGTGLDELCTVANSPEEMIDACHRLMQLPMTREEIARRELVLLPKYSNRHQAEKLKHFLLYEKALNDQRKTSD